MSVKKYCLAVLFLLLFSISAESEGNAITLLYPPDNTVREYDILGISVQLSKDAVDRLAVRVNGIEQTSIVPVIETECFVVFLKPGINIIELAAYKDGNVAALLKRHAYLRSDLIAEYRGIPVEFKRDYFHMEYRQECLKCHVLEPSIYDIKPISPAVFSANKFDSLTVLAATSTCYSCHKSMMSKAYAHGPASVWSCLSCHESDTIPEYSVRKPDTEMCYNCHVEQKNLWLSKKYTHGPVTIGKCTICHSPHASNNEFNLFKNAWDLCINCHAEKADGAHVIGDTTFKEGHPTRGRPDPLRVGKELTCASCHNPHASNSLHLWAFDVSDLFQLCSECHKKYSSK
jgi:predicted CXXCH cytochrome family protein